ncbi:6-phosphogluconolactonase [Gammaproteobacteria bacterium]|nr:6-phosphogluconolactonase [Gammaproteobacteria bacterium]
MENIAFKIAKSIASSLAESVLKKGYATLVVSGGNSPIKIFHHLNHLQIQWSKVTIILGDDRMIDASNIDSNDRLIRENLIINNAESANYISLSDPSFKSMQIKFPCDVTLLGMGLDGHFASLFPELLNNSSLFNMNAPHAIYISDIALGTPSHKRITMNLSMLLDTHRCILLVSNQSKRSVLDQASNNVSLPLYHLINQNKIKVECSDIDF